MLHQLRLMAEVLSSIIHSYWQLYSNRYWLFLLESRIYKVSGLSI